MKGGYKVVDFKNANLTSTRITDFGIAEQLEANVGKAVLLTNVKLNDAEMDDCFSTVIKKSENNFKLNCYDGFISITTSGIKYNSASVENLAEDLEELTANVGDIDDLETTDKTSAVAAINEVNGKVGDLDDLDTTNKDSAVAAINEVLGFAKEFFKPTKNLTNSNDLNSITEGVYYQTGGELPAHTPTADCNNFVVLQINMTSRLIQVLMSVNKNAIYYRTYAGNAWGSWYLVDAAAIV